MILYTSVLEEEGVRGEKRKRDAEDDGEEDDDQPLQDEVAPGCAVEQPCLVSSCMIAVPRGEVQLLQESVVLLFGLTIPTEICLSVNHNVCRKKFSFIFPL